MLQSGKMEEMQKFNVDLIALQEIRWKKQDQINKKETSTSIVKKREELGCVEPVLLIMYQYEKENFFNQIQRMFQIHLFYFNASTEESTKEKIFIMT